MADLLRIATYNIHKGLSQFNRRLSVNAVRDRLHMLGADVVFLQEVQGESQRRAQRFEEWPSKPQHEFFAENVWESTAYGKNAVYDGGHHGNAILSRFPIVRWENEDISAHRFESRGLLHCEMMLPGWDVPLHCICAHLALFERGRRQQIEVMCDRIERMAPSSEPVIIAGDFNDWHDRASKTLSARLGVKEVFKITGGRPARSYPARLPLLSLDRIYVRGFYVHSAHALQGQMWAKLSDHVALTAVLSRAAALSQAA